MEDTTNGVEKAEGGTDTEATRRDCTGSDVGQGGIIKIDEEIGRSCQERSDED